MSIENLEKRIEALEALIASSQLTHKYDNKLKIKGLDVTFEELQSSAQAQEMLISLHNDMHDAICRVAELEEENN
ncbi:MAG: hypothetical protein EB127_29550 [Alphaproteobacteria bacterium]|nr:hypothetical protein [Alphaproteobacteria bacterium]